MPRRKLLDKPTPQMKDRALLALDAIVADPTAPTHAKVSAARALVGPPPKEDQDSAKRAEAPSLTVIPDNGRGFPTRGPRTGLGLVWTGSHAQIIYDGKTEKGLADLKAWEAEYAAEVAARFPSSRCPRMRSYPHRRRRNRPTTLPKQGIFLGI
jgi:hypothetical protein